MSKESAQLPTFRRIVLFFDFCSSTSILEDLLDSENSRRWTSLIIRLKSFLHREQERMGYELYKFLGDGWILLFVSSQVTGLEMMRFLERLSLQYKKVFEQRISPVLNGEHPIGITFGIDVGTLVKVRMSRRTEYIGRPLNIAARLQGATKQKSKEPPVGKLLISNSAYSELRLSASRKYAGTPVTRSLANVSGGTSYKVRKILIPQRSDL